MNRIVCLLPLLLTVCTAVGEDASKTKWTELPAGAWHWNAHKKADGLAPMWKVEADGTLHHASGDQAWHQGDLISDDVYVNFILELDWKVGKTANSGVFYRIKDGDNYPWVSGFEYQILDDVGFHGGKAPPIQLAGAMYSILPPNDQKQLKPVGEWNTTRIVVQGNHVEHWLNGKCIVSVDLDSERYKTALAKSEWKGNPNKGSPANGHLGLQDHGGEVWYRNIRIQKL